MHELGLTTEICELIAARCGERQVLAIYLEIGALSGVAADSVAFCFELVSADFEQLRGARLEIATPPGRARCRHCNTLFEVKSALDGCVCGSFALDWTSGTALIVKAVEVATCAAPVVVPG
jgi:hydrogenase nickel incorporation protein HypA/HybF